MSAWRPPARIRAYSLTVAYRRRRAVRGDVMNFEQLCEKAGLTQIRIGKQGDTLATYVVWKPGLSSGLIVRPHTLCCFCSDCFCLYTSEEDRLILSQIRNIGLTEVAVNEKALYRERVELQLEEHGVRVISREESDIYAALQHLL